MRALATFHLARCLDTNKVYKRTRTTPHLSIVCLQKKKKKGLIVKTQIFFFHCLTLFWRLAHKIEQTPRQWQHEARGGSRRDASAANDTVY